MSAFDWMKKALSFLDPKEKQKEKEKVFDEKIKPLLMQLVKVCHENDIPIILALEIGENTACIEGGIKDKTVFLAARNLLTLFAESKINNDADVTYFESKLPTLSKAITIAVNDIYKRFKAKRR